MNSFEEIEKIREEYYKKHKTCPRCGSKNYTATLLCIPFSCLKSQEYKDTNRIICMECGYEGKIDDLKPENND